MQLPSVPPLNVAGNVVGNGNGNGKLFDLIVKMFIPAVLALGAWLCSATVDLRGKQEATDVKLQQLDRIERKVDRLYDFVTGFEKGK